MKVLSLMAIAMFFSTSVFASLHPWSPFICVGNGKFELKISKNHDHPSEEIVTVMMADEDDSPDADPLIFDNDKSNITEVFGEEVLDGETFEVEGGCLQFTQKSRLNRNYDD